MISFLRSALTVGVHLLSPSDSEAHRMKNFKLLGQSLQKFCQSFNFVHLASIVFTILSLLPFHINLRGFPGGSDSKESTRNAGDLDSIPGLGRSSGGGHGNPLQYSYLENPHRQWSLAGYRARGHKQSDVTE